MTEIKKVIHGYHVELHLSSEGEEWSDCYICKDGYSGTLGFVEALGYIENRHGDEHEIPQDTLETIARWAYARGY